MTQPSQADFDAILATSNRWMRAWMEQDADTLEACVAPDFTLIVSIAPTYAVDRAQWLAVAQRYICTQFAYRDVQFRDVGGIVLMSSIADQQARLDGIERNGPFFLTDAWRPTGEGTWQVCARYSSRPGESDAGIGALTNR
jgi:ketosteroid isomerase-like protein